MARALGTDDSVNACECCGKQNLKFTVVMALDSGEVAHYGQVCAARNTGKTPAAIQAEIRTEAQRIRDAAASEYRSSQARQAYEARLAQRPRELLGKPAMKFVRAWSQAADQARAAIAKAHGLQPSEVRG